MKKRILSEGHVRRMMKLANIGEIWILFVMRRPITYAELLLILALLPVGVIGVQHLHGFVTDRISIEIKLK